MAENNRIDPAYKYIDNKVKSIKTTITRLCNRIENIEILGLQEQITLLNSEIKKIDSILLRLERDVAQYRIKFDLLWAQWALSPIQDPKANVCIQYAREEAFAALAEVNNSVNPHIIASDWYSKCADYFHKHGNFEVFG